MKIVKLASKILLIILITAVSFVGIYVQKQNRMENIVKDYSWGKDIDGSRQIVLKVSDEKETITKDSNGKVVKEEDKKEDGKYTTEEKPVNPEEVKTLDNYNKSKDILEKRLKKFGVDDYTIKMNTVPLTITSTRLKYSGIYLINEVKENYTLKTIRQ